MRLILISDNAEDEHFSSDEYNDLILPGGEYATAPVKLAKGKWCAMVVVKAGTWAGTQTVEVSGSEGSWNAVKSGEISARPVQEDEGHTNSVRFNVGDESLQYRIRMRLSKPSSYTPLTFATWAQPI